MADYNENENTGNTDTGTGTGTQYYQSQDSGGQAPYGGQQQYDGQQQDQQQYRNQYQAQGYQQNYNYGEVPAEVRKWNWGAFMFGWIWGIGNHAYLTLLSLIPFLNIVWIFVNGALGNKWAWQSGHFKDVETFLAVQKTWNLAGLVYFILTIVGIILTIAFSAAIVGLILRYAPTMPNDLSVYGY